MANLLNTDTHLVTVHNIQIMHITILADNYKLSHDLRWEFGDIIRTTIRAEIKRRLQKGNGVIGDRGKDRTPEELHQAVVGMQDYWEAIETRERESNWEAVAEMLEEVADTIL